MLSNLKKNNITIKKTPYLVCVEKFALILIEKELNFDSLNKRQNCSLD